MSEEIKRLTVSPATGKKLLGIGNTLMAELIRDDVVDSVMIAGCRRITMESIERVARLGYQRPPRLPDDEAPPKRPRGRPRRVLLVLGKHAPQA